MKLRQTFSISDISGFQAASMKMTDLWDVAQRIFLEVDRRFRCAYCLLHQGPDVGGSKHL
jgi:hypothetical protein